MSLSSEFVLSAGGHPLDSSPQAWGTLTDSSDALHDVETLRARMDADGYLYLPGFFLREDVQAVRRSLAQTLAEEGALDPNAPLEACRAKPGLRMTFRPELANASQPLKDLIYSESVMAFYARLLGEPARHYDFTWLRAVAPGLGTSPHCDLVYMGRGTHEVYTAWVPLGDVPITVGGLIVLEGSHRRRDVREDYAVLDVDAVCDNAEAGRNVLEARGYQATGALDNDPAALRARFGGRWLSADFRMGDLLTFNMFLVHGSLDNASDQVRLSSDSRYQAASAPIDERWVGEVPPGHGDEAKRHLIC